MRLRNIPGSDEAIADSAFCVAEPWQYAGKWKEVFGNDHPIHIEVGMGKGKFLMRMAQLHPEINYIGIEMYSSVLLRAVQRAQRAVQEGEGGSNFRFVRMDARTLPEVFRMGEISRIYLNFSDPWPKDRHAKRRLTSAEFLRRYRQILPAGERVEFKTDNRDLFAFSLEQAKEEGWKILAHTWDLHKDAAMNDGNVMTEYEEKFAAQGNPICKMVLEVPEAKV